MKNFFKKLLFQFKNKTLRGAVLSVDILISFIVIAGLITFLITTIKPKIKEKVTEVTKQIKEISDEPDNQKE